MGTEADVVGEERWLPVPGSPGYEVSNRARARSIDRVITMRCQYGGTMERSCKGQLLKISPAGGRRKAKDGRRPFKGYMMVRLGWHGRYEPIGVFMLEAFVGPRPLGYDHCHRDGDSWNNSLENLYWGTRSENSFDAMRHGTHVVQVRARSGRLPKGEK